MTRIKEKQREKMCGFCDKEGTINARFSRQTSEERFWVYYPERAKQG